jgi:outer membrane protein OmpA-like peptidoglycan-associated protein
MDDVRARILARRARFLAVALAACGAPGKTGTPVDVPTGGADAGAPVPQEVVADAGSPGDGSAGAAEMGPPDPMDAGARVVVSVCLSIVLAPHLFFRPRDAHLDPRELPMLDAVAMTLAQHAEIVRVEVRGHVDGTEPTAVGLARARAARDYLVSKGVDPARLVTRNVGNAEPLADESTALGRAKNRRVDWRILLPDGGVP